MTGWIGPILAALPPAFTTPTGIIGIAVFGVVVVVLLSGLRASHIECLSPQRSRSIGALWIERGAVLVVVVLAAIVLGVVITAPRAGG